MKAKLSKAQIQGRVKGEEEAGTSLYLIAGVDTDC